VQSTLLRAGSGTFAATKQITDAMLKAQLLLKQQQEIDRQLDVQWEETGLMQQHWGGQLIEPAILDSWGRFPFIIARAQQDTTVGRQKLTKLLLRGRNGLTTEQLHRHLEQELARVAVERRVPCPKLELIGTGVAHWSVNPKRLTLEGKKLHSQIDNRLQSRNDIGRVGAAIAETVLPETCHIIVTKS
jgi:hypothetical protein